jgi:hypothetical protein
MWLEEAHMPGDPNVCREHAKRCWALASETKNPALKDSLVDLAQRWARLAVDLEFTRDLMAEWADNPDRAERAETATTGRLGSRFHLG